MIHHFARALAIREQARAQHGVSQGVQPRSPLGVDAQRSLPFDAPAALHHQSHGQRNQRLSIRRDPHDARRTVIAGRFADVCAALDRMAAELEAA